jgi:hypothetical protein
VTIPIRIHLIPLHAATRGKYALFGLRNLLLLFPIPPFLVSFVRTQRLPALEFSNAARKMTNPMAISGILNPSSSGPNLNRSPNPNANAIVNANANANPHPNPNSNPNLTPNPHPTPNPQLFISYLLLSPEQVADVTRNPAAGTSSSSLSNQRPLNLLLSPVNASPQSSTDPPSWLAETSNSRTQVSDQVTLVTIGSRVIFVPTASES